MPKVFIKTYGCQMNERDSDQVAQLFIQGGYTMTKEEKEADVILLNTCSVRHQAEQKALGKMGLIGKYRQQKPHLVYGFMGCMAQSKGDALFTKIPHLDVVVGTQKYHRVFSYVDEILSKRLKRRMDNPKNAYLGNNVCDIAEEEGSQNTIRDHFSDANSSSAFVSIMQGCNMRCSFCIVPDTRGRERGRPIAQIVEEITRLRDNGVKEITLLGQIVNLYGRTEFPIKEGKSPFVQLLEAIHQIEGIERIRFISPHPIGYREDLISAFTYLPKLCSHIHFPMQSGSDAILQKMRRPYRNARFIEICEKMKEARKDLAITTDIIVGFPGETEADYLETVKIVKKLEFDNAFIFRYSPRKNTPAAEMENQIPIQIKEERNQHLLSIVNEIAERKNTKLIGTHQQILCSGKSRYKKDYLTGRTSQNKIVVFQGEEKRLKGEIFDILIEDCTNFTLYGNPYF